MSEDTEFKPVEADYSKQVEDVSIDKVWDAAFNLGKDAIKIALLINSGAVIALLAFFGSVITSTGELTLWDTVKEHLLAVMYICALGVIMAAFSLCAAYFSQIYYYKAKYRENELYSRYEFHKFDNPFKEKYYSKFTKIGDIIRLISLSLCIASYAAFCISSFMMYRALIS